MRHLVLLLVLLVLGCDTAGPGFGGLPARPVEVEGTRFDLRLREDGMAEAIRTSIEYPNYAQISRRAGFAAEQVSGCTADWITGDPSVLRIGLACDGQRAPAQPRRRGTACALLERMAGAGCDP